METCGWVRALGIVGSPRRGGNTDILVNEVLQGAKAGGAQVEKVLLAGLHIAPCLGCLCCCVTGTCVQPDDMFALLEKMQSSDIWVLGTPVYWWGPTAQFKAFLDRWLCKSFLPETRVMFKDRRVILAIPMEDTNPEAARHLVGMMTESLNYMEVELFATLLAPGVLHAGQIREHRELLATARRIGSRAVGKPPLPCPGSCK